MEVDFKSISVNLLTLTGLWPRYKLNLLAVAGQQSIFLPKFAGRVSDSSQLEKVTVKKQVEQLAVDKLPVKPADLSRFMVTLKAKYSSCPMCDCDNMYALFRSSP